MMIEYVIVNPDIQALSKYFPFVSQRLFNISKSASEKWLKENHNLSFVYQRREDVIKTEDYKLIQSFARELSITEQTSNLCFLSKHISSVNLGGYDKFSEHLNTREEMRRQYYKDVEKISLLIHNEPEGTWPPVLPLFLFDQVKEIKLIFSSAQPISLKGILKDKIAIFLEEEIKKEISTEDYDSLKNKLTGKGNKASGRLAYLKLHTKSFRDYLREYTDLPTLESIALLIGKIYLVSGIELILSKKSIKSWNQFKEEERDISETDIVQYIKSLWQKR